MEEILIKCVIFVELIAISTVFFQLLKILFKSVPDLHTISFGELKFIIKFIDFGLFVSNFLVFLLNLMKINFINIYSIYGYKNESYMDTYNNINIMYEFIISRNIISIFNRSNTN